MLPVLYLSTPVPGCGYRGPGTEGWCFPFGFHQALEPKPGNWGGPRSQFTMTLCYVHGTVHGVMVTRDPAGRRQCRIRRSDHDGTRNLWGRPFAIFIQVSNKGRNCCKVCTRVHKYIPMKYTVCCTVQYCTVYTVQYSTVYTYCIIQYCTVL